MNAGALTGRFCALSSDVIMRTIVDIPDHQLAALAEWCERERISRAEAVRRALDAMLAQKKISSREACFGRWERRGNSREIVDALREEWS
jgi:metal-responsive CopG/Arc/MetJ family transcriptional regulator